MPRGGDIGGMDPAGGAAGLGQGGARYPLQGRHVCPFCGSVNETMEGPCPQCTMGNTAETRKATKSRIGPWYVLQSRNPAAPGMKYQTLLGFVRKGRVKARSIVRGPTTHQLWRFACQVKGLSREFGVCYSCGGSVERDAQLCPQCNRLQDPPADPDVFLEGQAGGVAPDAPSAQLQGLGAMPSQPRDVQQDAPRSPIFRELSLPPAFDIPATTSRGDASAMPSAPGAAALAPGVFDDVKVPEIPAAAPAAGVSLPPAPPAMAPQRPAPAAPASPSSVPPATPPQASTAKRNANDVFLSAKDLAAAFQLGFDGDGDEDDDNGAAPYARSGATTSSQPFDPEAPWANDAPAAAAWPPRSAPRRRRKRRLGRMLLLVVLLAAGAFGGYLAVDGVFRRRVFDWAEGKYMALTGADLYPDLGASRKTTGSSPTAAPGAAADTADADDANVDNDPVPAAVAPRRSPPPPATLPSPPATQASSGLFVDQTTGAGPRPNSGATAAPTTTPVAPRLPATAPRDTARAPADPEVSTPARPDVRVSPATQPVRTPPPQAEKKPEAPPQPTREQNLRKSAELWKRALAAEEAGDYRKAKATYEEIMKTLPKDVWYGGVESRLRVAKEMLGEK